MAASEIGAEGRQFTRARVSSVNFDGVFGLLLPVSTFGDFDRSQIKVAAPYVAASFVADPEYKSGRQNEIPIGGVRFQPSNEFAGKRSNTCEVLFMAASIIRQQIEMAQQV